MSERHWQRPALASTALALLGATAVAGCGGSASSSQASANQTAGAATATATAQAQSLTAAQLKGALLTQISGAKPAAPAEAGDYGALPDVKTSKQTMHGVKVAGLGNDGPGTERSG